MQGASLTSARLEIALDHAARALPPTVGSRPKSGCWRRLVISKSSALIIVSLRASRNPLKMKFEPMQQLAGYRASHWMTDIRAVVAITIAIVFRGWATNQNDVSNPERLRLKPLWPR